MKIAFVCQSYPPMVSGAALVVQRLAEGLAGRGHVVLVIAASDRRQAYTQIERRVRVARLASWPNPFRVGQRFLLNPRTDLMRELRVFQPDVIHLEDFGLAGAAGAAAAQRMEVPLVVTLHQLPWMMRAYLPPVLGASGERVLWRHLRRFTASAHVITPSAVIADLAAHYLPQRPTPLSNGIATQHFSPHPLAANEVAQLRARYHLDPRLPVILHVGRLDAEKKVDVVLRAAAVALWQFPAQVLIVGDGTHRAKLERLSQQLKLESHTHFAGYVSADGDLPGLYRLASVFITASEMEIQSSVVLEALACGVPVVAVQASSMSEFIEHSVNGYLAAPGDVAGLAQHLITVLQQPPDPAQAMRQAALATARAHSMEHAVEAHEYFYQRMQRTSANG